MHMYPELSFQETQTARWICSELDKLGIDWNQGYANNGIRAIISRGKGPVTALRADFDALPIQELNDIPFKSRHPGVMHACGHDVHSAILLTSLEILREIPDWKGTVVGIFQPAEEKNPGGARAMIEGGVLKDPDVGRIFGGHINPALESGTMGMRSGLMMASADELYLKILGRGGHAALPHLTLDPVAVAAQVIVALQQIVSRSSDPQIPTVLSFGRLIAEGATNVIPDEVRMEGTFRTIDEQWRNEALERIEKTAIGVSEALGAGCDLRIDRGYPVLVNDAMLCLQAQEDAITYLGKDKIYDLPLIMWAEDFAYYGQEVPACFYNLGVGNRSRGWTSSLHSPKLMVDEASIETGSGLMAWIAIRDLEAQAREGLV